MRIREGTNLTKIKQTNDKSILAMIYQKGPVSRGEVSRYLGITLPTATTKIKEFLEEGILLETEMEVQDYSLGRKATAVDIARDSRYVIGIEWSPYGPVCCVSDLRGKVLAKNKFEKQSGSEVKIIDMKYDWMLTVTKEQIEAVLAESGIPRDKILGVGWTSPGMIEAERGIIVRSSMNHVKWNHMPVKADLEALLSMPVAVINHVKARAIGQDMFCREERPEVYLYYFVQEGISCCIMIDGEPFGKGCYGTGDIGHTIMDIHGPVCACGKRGCLQAFSGEQAIRNNAAVLLEARKYSTVEGDHILHIPLIQEIMGAAECGDEELAALLKTAVLYMGISIANIMNLVNSQLVVIDSTLMENRSLREYLDQVIQEHILFKTEVGFKTEYIMASRYTGAQGACALAVKELLIR